MLTNLFYYDYYRPYIVKDAVNANKTSNVKTMPEMTFDINPFSSGKPNQSPKLNRTLKSDVISYTYNFAKSTVRLKDALKRVFFTVERMERQNSQIISQEESEAEHNRFSRDLSAFVWYMNNASGFANSQTHSEILRGYINDQTATLLDNEPLLNKFGINIVSSGGGLPEEQEFTLEYDSEKAAASPELSDIKVLKDVFGGMYGLSSEMLRIPLSEHMKFKELKYYYNYKLGALDKDTFKIIENGMIFDIAI